LNSSTDDRIAVGRIGRPHGLRGEVTVLPETDDPGRFVSGSSFVIDDGRVLTLTSVAPYRDRGLVLAFDGVDDRRAAEDLRGTTLFILASDRRSLGPGEYWPDDLVGLVAVSAAGEPLGKVTAVDLGAGQDRLVVSTQSGEDVLVPFVSDLVGDPVGGEIVIDAPEGLFP
jgi:16S rRNA processing protein RimM